MSNFEPVMTAAELNTYIVEVYPQIIEQFPDLRVVSVEPGRVLVHLKTDQRHLRAGNTVSGPSLFSLADMGGYVCALSHIGHVALAVTTNLNINFMRKAEMGTLEAHCTILKLGKRLMVFEATICQAGEDDVIAHASGTYAIPPVQ
jgi:uncharacterized protein (TIGR00369 family)